MTCGCMSSGGVDSFGRKRPSTRCVFCAEKHVSTAYALAQERGYEGTNRAWIIGELVLAQWHLAGGEAAEKLREARHLVQARREKDVDWSGVLVAVADLAAAAAAKGGGGD